MRHDPTDAEWVGRDRFVLSCGHSSLTLYIQLYLSGYGLELDDLKALRTWGSLTPGPPGARPHRRRRDHHRPARPGRRQRGRHGDGRPPRARPARPGRRARREPVRPPRLRDRLRRRPRGGRHRRGLARSPATSSSATSTLIYDDNHISIEDDTDVAFSEDVAARYAAYGWHVQTVDWTDDGAYVEDVDALDAALEAAKAETEPPVVHRAAHDHRLARPDAAEHRQGARLRARRRRGRRDQGAARLRPRARPSTSTTRSSRTPARSVDRGRAAHAEWEDALRGLARRPTPTRAALFDRLQRRSGCPTAGPTRCPTFDAGRQGHRHPHGVRQGARRARRRAARAVGRLGRPRRVQQHDDRGRAVLPPGRPADQGLAGRPVRPHAALRHPRARHGRDHERHRAARPDPALRRHVPGLQRLHAPGGAPRRADEAAGHLRLDARLDRPRRGRPDPPAGRAPGRAARDPRPRRRPPGRRQRDRRRPGARSWSTRPPGRARPDPAEPADRRPRRGRLRAPPRASPRAATCSPRRTATRPA